jgi:hypothetical protein
MIAAALVSAGWALLEAAPARADVGTTIIERCTHGQPVGGFTQQAYRRALQELPTEVEEYSDCANVIRRAQLAAAGAGTGARGTLAGAGAGTTPLTPAEQQRLGAVVHTRAAPLRVGNQLIHPGEVHADVASAFSSLPDALLAILALIAASALVLAVITIRSRVWNRTPRSRVWNRTPR